MTDVCTEYTKGCDYFSEHLIKSDCRPGETRCNAIGTGRTRREAVYCGGIRRNRVKCGTRYNPVEPDTGRAEAGGAPADYGTVKPNETRGDPAGSSMCGIAGLWKSEEAVTRLEVETLRDTMVHRGPDAAGVWIDVENNIGLGHRRLAIIDLSEEAEQPMGSTSGNLQIVYNGEIYNFLGLREEAEKWGYRFRTRSDTEVILAYYEKYGIECVEYFRGMFAFGVWDREKRCLTMARDRVGIKPLYYYWDGVNFAFSSEFKGFQSLPLFDKTLDVTAAYDYLTYQYIPPPKSMFKYVRKVEAGQIVRFWPEKRDIERRRYWRVECQEVVPEVEEEEVKERVRELLGESVEGHLVADVPVGAFLSGGTDSSMVTALAAAKHGDFSTFTVDFDVPEKSEAGYARLVAEFLGVGNSVMKMGGGAFREFADRFVEMYDEPFGDTSGLPTFVVSSEAAKHVKVVLSGDGGDEVFGGYVDRRFLGKNGESAVAKSSLAGKVLAGLPFKYGEGFLRERLTGAERTMQVPVWLNRGQKERMFEREALAEYIPGDYDYLWYIRENFTETGDSVRNRMLLEFRTWLPEKMLTKVDRASMVSSLEVRVPLLDHKLVEYMFSLPTRYVWDERKGGKWLLKELLMEYLPENLVNRPKKGFSIPITQWLDGMEGEWMERVAGSRIAKEGVLDVKRISRADTRSPVTKWMLMNLALWSDRYQWSL